MFNLRRTYKKSNQKDLAVHFILIALFNSVFYFNITYALPENLLASQINTLTDVNTSLTELDCVGASNAKLYCSVYNAKPKLNRAILIVTGFTESHSQYSELIYDLAQKGFGPIFIYDHRGQGESQRLTTKKIATVDIAQNYVSDFNNVLKVVDSYLFNNFPKSTLTILSHSMGSLIVTNAASMLLPNGRISIDAHIMIAPFFAMRLGASLDALLDSGRSRLVTGLLRLMSCPSTFIKGYRASLCETLAPGAKYSLESQTIAEKSRVTNSQTRLDIHNKFRKSVSDGGFVQSDQSFEGTSAAWVIEMVGLLNITNKMINNYNLNTLVVLSEDDTIVRTERTKSMLCNGKANIKCIGIKGKHALHIEADPARDLLLKEISDYILSTKL